MAANWDEWASSAPTRGISAYLQRIIDKIEVSPDGKVLDLGCGSGRFSIYFSKKAKRVIAVDNNGLSLGLLRQKLKKEKIKNVYVVNRSIDDLGFLKDKEIDTTFVSITLQHLKGKSFEKAIREINRVTKKQIVLLETVRKFSGRPEITARSPKEYAGLFPNFELRENYGAIFPYLIYISQAILEFSKKVSEPLHRLAARFPVLSPQNVMVFSIKPGISNNSKQKHRYK